MVPFQPWHSKTAWPGAYNFCLPVSGLSSCKTPVLISQNPTGGLHHQQWELVLLLLPEFLIRLKMFLSPEGFFSFLCFLIIESGPMEVISVCSMGSEEGCWVGTDPRLTRLELSIEDIEEMLAELSEAGRWQNSDSSCRTLVLLPAWKPRPPEEEMSTDGLLGEEDEREGEEEAEAIVFVPYLQHRGSHEITINRDDCIYLCVISKIKKDNLIQCQLNWYRGLYRHA